MVSRVQEGESGPAEFAPASIVEASDSEIMSDHGERPLEEGDYARIWRHTSLPGVELFRGSYQKYRFARHFHRVPVIGVVDRGLMSSYFRRGNHLLEPGTVVLLNPGEIHAPAPGGVSGWSMRMFYLEEDFLRSIAPDLSLQRLRFRKPYVQDQELASQLIQLHLSMQRGGERLQFESTFLEIVSRLVDRHIEMPGLNSVPKPEQSAIRKALEYLEANCARNVSVTELSKLSPYGPSHFLRIFKEVTGLTPHAYLTQFRVELAIAQIRSGKALVEVANMVGFSDQSHFTKRFKRIFGLPPGQYAAAYL